jgi:hypothetical protein
MLKGGEVMLLTVDAVAGFDDEPIGYRQVPVPGFSDHRPTSCWVQS